MNNYVLRCGHYTYEVDREAEQLLKAVIYWNWEHKLCKEEYLAAQKYREQYSDTEFAELERAYNQACETVRARMIDMDKMDIPNWVGNGALHWGETHDLRREYLGNFFTQSVYATK